MKLNGKVYLNKKIFEELMEKIILELGLSNFTKIDKGLSELSSTDVDNVVELLVVARNKIFLMFDKELCVPASTLLEYMDELMYDPLEDEVALYKYGAYGVKVKAPDPAVKKYAFNICAVYLKKQIRKQQ